MRGRWAVLVVALPVTAYLALLALVAALYVHPPLLGWIGFALVGALGAGLAVGAFILFPRMRTSVEPVDATAPGRLVVLVDADCPDERVCNAVAGHLALRGDAEVLVVAPVLASPLHYLAGEEERERLAARVRLDAVLTGLHLRGIRARGRLGDDDPLQSLGDALAAFPAGEALLITASDHWLEHGLAERARRLVPELELVHAA